jgi:hypothetical protein
LYATADNSLSAIAEAWADPNRPKDGEEPYIWVLFKDGDKVRPPVHS